MVHILHVESDLFHLARSKRFRLFETVTELPAEWLPTHQLLVSAHVERWRRHVRPRLVFLLRFSLIKLAVRIVRRINIEQLHIPIGIGSAGRHKKSREDRSRNGHIFLQHGCFVHQNIRSAVRKPLIREHVFLRDGGRSVIYKRHGLRWIAHVFIESAGIGSRWIEGKPATRTEIERLRLGLLRRPCRVSSPHIRSSLEHVSLRKLRVAIAFEILLEKWEQDIFSVVIAGIKREFYSSQMLTLVPRPTAVHPGTNYQRIKNPGIVFVDGVKCAERTLQVFGVEPSPDG